MLVLFCSPNQKVSRAHHRRYISAVFSSQFPILKYQNLFHFASCNDKHFHLHSSTRQLLLPCLCLNFKILYKVIIIRAITDTSIKYQKPQCCVVSECTWLSPSRWYNKNRYEAWVKFTCLRFILRITIGKSYSLCCCSIAYRNYRGKMHFCCCQEKRSLHFLTRNGCTEYLRLHLTNEWHHKLESDTAGSTEVFSYDPSVAVAKQKHLYWSHIVAFVIFKTLEQDSEKLFIHIVSGSLFHKVF